MRNYHTYFKPLFALSKKNILSRLEGKEDIYERLLIISYNLHKRSTLLFRSTKMVNCFGLPPNFHYADSLVN